MKISATKNNVFLSVGVAFRCSVSIYGGPWVAGVDPDTIKIRPKNVLNFPKEVADAFAIENNSDLAIDYFERDTIRLLPGHPLYDMAKTALAQQLAAQGHA